MVGHCLVVDDDDCIDWGVFAAYLGNDGASDRRYYDPWDEGLPRMPLADWLFSGQELDTASEERALLSPPLVILAEPLRNISLEKPALAAVTPNQVLVVAAPPVEEQRIRLLQRFNQAAADLVVPAVIGGLVNAVTRSALTALVASAGISFAAAPLVALGAGVVIGALAGAVSTFAQESAKKNKTEGWQRRAITKGLITGLCGGIIGSVVTDLLSANSFVAGLFEPQAIPAVPASAAPVPVAPPQIVPTVAVPLPPVVPVSPDLAAYESAVKSMPRSVQHLYESANKTHNPQTVLKFFKEASFNLLQHPRHAESLQVGAKMLQEGAAWAQKVGLSTGAGRGLVQDLIYCEATGRCGITKNIGAALELAKQLPHPNGFTRRLLQAAVPGLR